MTRDGRLWWRIVMGWVLVLAVLPNLLAYASVKWLNNSDLVRLGPDWLCELDYTGPSPAHLRRKEADVRLARLELIHTTHLGGSRVRVILPFDSREAYEAHKEYENGIRELASAGVDVKGLRGAARAYVGRSEFRTMSMRRREDITRSFDRAVAALAAENPEQAERIDATASAYRRYRDREATLLDPDRVLTVLNRSGKLEFRIAPTRATGSGSSDLTDARAREYLDKLAEAGPEADGKDGPYLWFPVRHGAERLSPKLITARYAGRTYLLLENRGEFTMLRRPRSSRWSLRARSGADALGRPAVRFRLDARGGKLMGDLTGANKNSFLAILLDDEVHSAPVIKDTIYTEGVIEGSFTAGDVNQMIMTLDGSGLFDLGVRFSLASATMRSGRDPPKAGLKRAGLWATGIAAVALLAIWLIATIKGHLHLAALAAVLIPLAAMAFWLLVQWNNLAAQYVGGISLVGNGATVLGLAAVWFLAAYLAWPYSPPLLPAAGQAAAEGE